MKRRPPRCAVQGGAVGVRWLPVPEVIMLAVRWFLRFGSHTVTSKSSSTERGIDVDHVNVYRWCNAPDTIIFGSRPPDQLTEVRRAPAAMSRQCRTAHVDQQRNRACSVRCARYRCATGTSGMLAGSAARRLRGCGSGGRGSSFEVGPARVWVCVRRVGDRCCVLADLGLRCGRRGRVCGGDPAGRGGRGG